MSQVPCLFIRRIHTTLIAPLFTSTLSEISLAQQPSKNNAKILLCPVCLECKPFYCLLVRTPSSCQDTTQIRMPPATVPWHTSRLLSHKKAWYVTKRN